MRMPWFRMYHEARNDRKLDTLADDEFRVWHRLLCFASEQEERGVIAYDDLFLLAIEVARGDQELLSHVVTRLSALKIIRDDGHALVFLNFVKRNYDKPSDAPEATRERKRKSRMNTEKTDDRADAVTPRHAQEEIRGDKKREEESRESVSNTPAPAPMPVPKRADARATLPSANDLIEHLRPWAEERGVRDILADEVDRFRDYCLSGKNGKPIAYADYAAACRKWITNPSYGHSARAPTPLVVNGSPIPANSRTARNIRVLQETDW